MCVTTSYVEKGNGFIIDHEDAVSQAWGRETLLMLIKFQSTLVSGSPWDGRQAWTHWPSWSKRRAWQHRIPWAQGSHCKNHLNLLSLGTFIFGPHFTKTLVFLTCLGLLYFKGVPLNMGKLQAAYHIKSQSPVYHSLYTCWKSISWVMLLQTQCPLLYMELQGDVLYLGQQNSRTRNLKNKSKKLTFQNCYGYFAI